MIFRKLTAFIAMLAVVLGLAVINVRAMVSPRQWEERLRQDLQAVFAGDIRIGRVEFSFSEGLTVEDLELRDKPGGELLLRVSRARFEHKPILLVIGRVSMKTVELDGSLYVRRRGGELQWFQSMKPFYVDPRARLTRGTLLDFDTLRSRFNVYVQDDNVFHDDRIQHFAGEIDIQRDPNDRRTHVVGGLFGNPFWGDWRLGGTLQFYRDQPSSIWLRNDAFPLDYQVKEQFVRRLQVQWENLRPEGMAAIEARAEGRLNDLGRTFSSYILMQPLGAEVTLYNFPYPVRNLGGDIVVDRSGIRFVHCTGSNDEALFQISGGIDGFGRLAGVDLSIEAAGLTIDEQFYLALNESTRKVFDACEPSGRIDIAARLKREPGIGGPIPPYFDVLLRDTSFRVSYFPYPIEHAAGILRIRQRYVSIESLVAERDGRRVEVYDSEFWSPEPGKLACNLKVRGDHVPVDDALLNAFPEAYRATFERFHLDGTVSLDALVSKSPEGGPLEYSARVRPEDLAFRFEYFPYAAHVTGGELVFRPGLTQLVNLQGTHGETTVGFSGEVRYPKGEGLQVDLDLDFGSLHWDREFASALLPTAGEKLDQVKLDGPLDMTASVRYRKDAGGIVRSEYDAAISLQDAVVQAGLEFQHVTGDLRLQVRREPDAPLKLDGFASLDSLELWKRAFKGMKLEYHYLGAATGRDGSLELTIAPGSAKNYGGKLKGGMQIVFPAGAPARYDGEFFLQNFNTSIISDAVFRDNKNGLINGFVKFQGDTSSRDTMTGGGAIDMDEVRLWEVPLLSALINMIQLKDYRDTQFHDADVDFTIAGGRFEFTDMNFDSDSIDFHGAGTMGFSGDLDLNMRMAIAPEFMQEIPAIGQLFSAIIDGVTYVLVTADVRGTVQQPKIVVKPLSPVSSIFSELFSRKRKQPKESKPVVEEE